MGNSLFSLDFSQVEYRILCGLAGQQDKLAALQAGRDLYCEFGTRLFGRTITKDDYRERQYSKRHGVLSCGYGKGKDRSAAQSKADGYDFPRAITDRTVDEYRASHPHVVAFWKKCDEALPHIAAGEDYVTPGPKNLLKSQDHCLIFPNGTRARLDLVWCPEIKSWFKKTYRGGAAEKGDDSATLRSKGYTKHWGGELTALCCQALARVRLSDLMVKAKRELGIRPVFLVHDEYVGIAPDEEAPELLARMIELAREPSPWWPDGPPFDAEGTVSKRYEH